MLIACRRTCPAFKKRWNKPASRLTLHLYSDLDDDQTLQIIAPDLERSQRQQILRAHAKIYGTEYLQSAKAFRGVDKLFETLTDWRQDRPREPGAEDYLSLLDARQLLAVTMSSTASPTPASLAWH